MAYSWGQISLQLNLALISIILNRFNSLAACLISKISKKPKPEIITLIEKTDGSAQSRVIDDLNTYIALLITVYGQDGGWYSSPAGFLDLSAGSNVVSTTIQCGVTTYTGTSELPDKHTRNISANLSDNKIILGGTSGTYRRGYVSIEGIR